MVHLPQKRHKTHFVPNQKQAVFLPEIGGKPTYCLEVRKARKKKMISQVKTSSARLEVNLIRRNKKKNPSQSGQTRRFSVKNGKRTRKTSLRRKRRHRKIPKTKVPRNKHNRRVRKLVKQHRHLSRVRRWNQ